MPVVFNVKTRNCCYLFPPKCSEIVSRGKENELFNHILIRGSILRCFTIQFAEIDESRLSRNSRVKYIKIGRLLTLFSASAFKLLKIPNSSKTGVLYDFCIPLRSY